MSFGIRTTRVASLNGTFVPLLAGLLVVLVVMPIAEMWPLASAILVTIVLVTGIFTIGENPLLRRVVVVMLAIVLGLRWTAHLHGEEHRSLVVISHLAIGMHMSLLAVICSTAVLRRQQITRDTVLGAVCGYILTAFVFAYAYAALSDLVPGSFSSNVVLPEYEGTKIGHGTPELLYYSFATLTTVGYGDIIPANRMARSLAILEMLAGQLYLAAFVARLVGAMGAGTIGPRDRPSDGPGS
jgi:voltage-gated potassium channel